MSSNIALRVFFSWQSELSRQTTTLPIERALQQAKTSLLAEDLHVEIQSGPLREGAVDIADSIAQQIFACDLYVADVSIVDRGSGRPSPNANVLFEVGLAVGSQGWNRVVLLLNKETGAPEDLPFDLRGRAVSTFDYRSAQDKGDINKLATLLANEFRRAISSPPPRPRGHDEAVVRRSRDIVQLQRFFTTISRPLMDIHLREGPKQRHLDVARMFDIANAVADSSMFRLSDIKMERRVREFLASLERTLEYDEFYRDTNRDGVETFGNRSSNLTQGLIVAGHMAKAFETLTRAHNRLTNHWNELLDAIHKHYVEIDLAATDAAATKVLHVDDDED